MRKKNIALYDPYLNTLGGGEKHILSILRVLKDEDYEITIFWDKKLQQEINQRFSLFHNIIMEWLPNIFKPANSLLNKLRILINFDMFFYITDGSYFFSTAKKNFVFCMVPKKELYKMTVLNRIKTLNYNFIANSRFTQSWLKKWGIKSSVIYPYINQDIIDLKVGELKKDKIILSVGRFYSHLHSKKQSEIINLFKQLRQNNTLFKEFKLILAGGLKNEDKTYFEKLRSQIKNDSNIILKTNISYEKLIDLYKKSLFYLHLTGFKVDENKNPEFVEHLGIAPLEAMSSGCITFAYNAGGPKEIIKDGFTGFLFNNKSELFGKMDAILKNTDRQEKMKIEAKKFVVKNFSYGVFKQRVKQIIL